MKTSIVLGTFLLMAFHVFGQAKISFEKGEHDFGKIKEDGGSVEYAFKFKNTGDKALKLTNVQASCGCTTPSWTEDEIQPNGTGIIKAAYDPMNRPGAFTKTITVQTNEPQTLYLTIKGEVIARPKGPQDWYPMEMGALRFRTTFISFDQIFKTGKDTASTIIYNQGTEAIKIYPAQTQLPPHLSLKADVEVIQPKKTAKLIFTYDASKINDWGYVYESIDLKTSDAQMPDKRLSISADIQEDFSKVDINNAPQISFDKTTHNFGLMAQNQSATTSFTITNNGKSDLLIRKAKASCGCTATEPKKSVLKPNESTTIEVTYSSGTQQGNQKKSVTIISNDPKQSNIQLYIEADVQETPQNVPTEVDLTKNDNNTTPQQQEKPTAELSLKIGEKVYNTQNGVQLTAFVEDIQGEKIKLRIAKLKGKKKLDYDGTPIKENSIIWDDAQKWTSQAN